MLVIAVTGLGCGRVGFDGPSGDAAIARGTASVITLGRGSPPSTYVGAIVWSSHADGSVDDVTVSDGMGLAAVTVDAGGMVTTAYDDPVYGYELRTVYDVAPGDELAFGAKYNECDQTPRGTITIAWPTVAGATNYRFGVQCMYVGAAGGSTSYPWDVSNAVPDPMDLVVRAVDADLNPLQIASKLAVPFAGGTTVTVDAADWIVPPRHTVGVTGVAAPFTVGDLQALFRMPTVPDAGGQDSVFEIPLVQGALTMDARTPAGTAQIVVLGAVHSMTNTLTFSHVFSAPFAASLVQPMPPPPPILAEPGYDPSARRVVWTETANGDADAVGVTVEFTGGTIGWWTAWAPVPRTEVVFPEPPAELAVSGTPSALSIVMVRFEIATTWPETRRRAEWNTPFDVLGFESHVTSEMSLEL